MKTVISVSFQDHLEETWKAEFTEVPDIINIEQILLTIHDLRDKVFKSSYLEPR